ncbi:MAG: RNA polymerase sigma factor [Saprospiraceae bacterium]|nr:RNA polymerase sigma factor [Saprospiraceae bacterium]
MVHPEDQLILELISSTDKKDVGFRYLLNKYKERLYWHIRRMVQSHEDADDVIQNTFIKVYRNIHNFQQNSSLYTWLYRIATNETINFINSRKNLKIESVDVLTNQLQVRQEVHFDEDEAIEKLRKAVETLPDKQKLVFHLRYYDELPYDKIAEITDTSVGALKASYHHAVKKIEEKLKSAF